MDNDIKRPPIRRINEPRRGMRPIEDKSEKPLGRSSEVTLVTNFLCQLEGWKTRTKNLHWSARHKDIHEYLDAFHGVLNDYEDGLAETFLGINPNSIKPTDINGILCNVTNAFDLITEVSDKTCAFYEELPKDTVYVGIRSECETFIKSIKQYDYLFHLCDV